MKIAFFVSRFPYPLEKGDKLRAFNIIRQLSKRHDVTLFAVTDRSVTDKDKEALLPYCSSIHIHYRSKISIAISLLKNILSEMPYSVAYFYSKHADRMWQKIIKQIQPDLIFSQLIRAAPYSSHYSCNKALDYMDCFSKGMYQREQQNHGFIRWIYGAEFERLRKYEQKCLYDFNIHTIISEEDKNSFSFTEKAKISVVPNGVDTEYFQPVQEDKNYDLLFTGNMAYPPNINAVVFLVKKILPLIWIKRPQTNLLIAGANPAKEVRLLQSNKVNVSGWIDDMRNSYNQSRVFVAPMQMGIGMQNKVLEAMAMQLPCIVSTMVNSAIHADVGKEIITANTPDEFLGAILRLLDNRDESEQLSKAGREFVLKKHNWEKIGDELNQLIAANPK